MAVLTVSDILKILDKTPIWKTLKDMPERISELETRIAALERDRKLPDHLHTCAECGAPAKVTGISDHPTFGFAGRKVRTITCENGHSLKYDWTPGQD